MLDGVVALLPAKMQPYAKAIVAAVLAVLVIVAATTDLPMWVTILVAVLSPAAVHATPNRGYVAKPIQP